MTPIRLLILGVLLYIGWRMLKGKPKKPVTTVPPEAGQEADPQDVLVEDPVCHVLIPKHQALRLLRDGVTHYFCSERCCDLFTEQSEHETQQGAK